MSEEIIAMMKDADIPVTRENYIELAWGLPIPPWTAELEAELPEQLQDWTLFETVNGELVLKT
jgi:hypothetical protein